MNRINNLTDKEIEEDCLNLMMNVTHFMLNKNLNMKINTWNRKVMAKTLNYKQIGTLKIFIYHKL